MPKIRMSSSRGPYYYSVRHYDDVNKKFKVLKNIEFRIKPKGVTHSCYKKRVFATITDQKSIFLSHEGHLLPHLDVKMLYIIF
jgi:hypothetical protein